MPPKKDKKPTVQLFLTPDGKPYIKVGRRKMYLNLPKEILLKIKTVDDLIKFVELGTKVKRKRRPIKRKKKDERKDEGPTMQFQPPPPPTVIKIEETREPDRRNIIEEVKNAVEGVVRPMLPPAEVKALPPADGKGDDVLTFTRAQVKYVEGEFKKKEQKLIQLTDRVDGIRDEKTRLEYDLQRLAEDQKNAQEQLQTVMNERDVAQSEKAKAAQNLEDLNMQLRVAGEELEKAETALNDFTNQMNTLRQEVEALKVEKYTAIAMQKLVKEYKTRAGREVMYKKVMDELKRDLIEETKNTHPEKQVRNLNAVSLDDAWAAFQETPFFQAELRRYITDERNKAEPQQGTGYSQSGLYGSEVSEIMSDWPNYLGTISRNDLKSLKKIPQDDASGFVMNLDPPGKPGSHWVAIFIDPVEDLSIEYYDPFGRPADKDIQEKTIKGIAKKFDHLDYYLKFKWNMVKHQKINNNNCGWHCADFLKKRANGVSFAEATGFALKHNSEVNKQEKEVKALKDQFPKFGHIEDS